MTAPRSLFAAGLLLGSVLVVGSLACADSDYVKIPFVPVGDRPPAFTLPDDDGKPWVSSKHFGKKPVVVFFYLGDFVPSCTKQAILYRQKLGTLKSLGVEVVGISGDSVDNHEWFKSQYQLGYTLLADVEGKVAREFGVPVSGSGMAEFKDSKGKVHALEHKTTISQWTFVVGSSGRVIYKKTNVNPAEDAREVLTFLQQLLDAKSK
jgi:peroxiredoxin Q/BCP